jgi:hypothetical protein
LGLICTIRKKGDGMPPIDSATNGATRVALVRASLPSRATCRPRARANRHSIMRARRQGRREVPISRPDPERAITAADIKLMPTASFQTGSRAPSWAAGPTAQRDGRGFQSENSDSRPITMRNREADGISSYKPLRTPFVLATEDGRCLHRLADVDLTAMVAFRSPPCYARVVIVLRN